MDYLYMFKICQILPSHPISKQIMFRFAIARHCSNHHELSRLLAGGF